MTNLLTNSVNLLLLTIVLLFIFILIIMLIPSEKVELIKQFSLFSSLFIFILTLILWIFFNNELGNFIFVSHIPWLSNFNIYYSIGIDGISIFFIILTAFLIPICMLISWESVTYKTKEFFLMLLITELLLINVFAVLDLFFFYIFFESVLIPMFIIIGVFISLVLSLV